jgi:ribokinase
VTRVVVVGSANVDFVWHGARLPAPGETVGDGVLTRTFGGKGANQAAAAARLGAEVAFVGCVGDDDLGASIRADLLGLGVDCTHLVTVADVATGVALIHVAERGENTIAVAPGANHHVTSAAVRAACDARQGAPTIDALIAGFEVGSACAAAAIELGGDRGITTVCNPSPVDVDSRESASAIARSDIVIVNEVEADAYGGAGAILASGADCVVVTRGARGATVIDGAGTTDIDGFDVDAIDSTGAGDAFCAAYALRRDLAFACAAGALACRSLGARASQPTVADVDALVRAQPRSPR